MHDDPFQLTSSSRALLTRAAFAAARPFAGWLCRLGTFRELYARAAEERGLSFVDAALRTLEIEIECTGRLWDIPARGPLIVAGNHPHGAVDGLALLSMVQHVRPDVRLLANHLLARIPELRESCFFVDPFGGPGATARSMAGLRAAHLWLRGGGAIIVFPAGEVGYRTDAGGTAIDAEWKPTIGRLALATGARVLPAFIEGSNSRLFRAAGRLHWSLRTALLPRELLAKRGARIRIALGRAWTPGHGWRPAIGRVTTRIRRRVERARLSSLPASVAGAGAVRVHDAGDAAAEIAALPPGSRLVDGGELQVYCAAAAGIPATLLEIGRLRERTFRAAGEGTGRELDLDLFDRTYLHLFVWDRACGRIAGAYRIGRTDVIAATSGVGGLYTRTLFRFDRSLLDAMPPALELGRSFVREEYQRHPLVLALLWKGICRFVSLHPEYRCLFGAVSISSRYSAASRSLLAAFLERHCRDDVLWPLVAPAARTRAVPHAGTTIEPPPAVEAADRAVTLLEHDGKGMPVLLRQYLKLDARVAGLAIDPAFAHTLDALIVVDLLGASRALLQRYFGRTELSAYLACHGADMDRAA